MCVFVLIFDFVFVFEKKEACCQPLHLLYARGGKDARGRAGGSATQMHSLGSPRCIVLYLYLYYIVLYCIALYCIVLLCIPSVLGDALYCICICIALYLYLYCIALYCIAMHSLGLRRCIQKNFPRIETLWNVSGRRKGNLNLVCKHAFDQVNIIRHVV